MPVRVNRVEAGAAPRDEELVADHLRGDPEAFTRLVRRYAGRLFNLAYRFTADRAEAEDIAQESLLRAYQALPRARVDQPFRPWLYQIALNLCRDWARKKRPATFTELEAGEEGEDPVEAIPDEAPLPAEVWEIHEMEAALREAVMASPETDRMLLTLRYNEGLSYDTIGQIMHLPAATVGTHLFRAKRRLRAALMQDIPVDYA